MAPHKQVSVVLKAGLPPIITVVLPIGNGLLVGACAGGGITHTWLSPTTAAGMPCIITVGMPGPTMVPPWVVTSSTRAADGMVLLVF